MTLRDLYTLLDMPIPKDTHTEENLDKELEEFTMDINPADYF